MAWSDGVRADSAMAVKGVWKREEMEEHVWMTGVPVAEATPERSEKSYVLSEDMAV